MKNFIKRLKTSVVEFARIFPATPFPMRVDPLKLSEQRVGLFSVATKEQQAAYMKLHIKRFKYEARKFQEKQDLDLEFSNGTCQ